MSVSALALEDAALPWVVALFNIKAKRPQPPRPFIIAGKMEYNTIQAVSRQVTFLK